MKLQEILDKATPRPWGGKDLSPIVSSVYPHHVLTAPTQVMSNTDYDLARHAVNRFEALLRDAKAILPFLPGDVVTKTKPKHVQAAQALREAIRQAEEVAT